MVGRDGRQHDVGQGEEKQTEQTGVEQGKTHHLAQQSVKKHQRIEGCEDLHSCHNEDGTVDAREPHQALVNHIWHIHEEGQQGMAKHVVACLPIANHHVGDGIEAREVEVANNEVPIVGLQGREKLVIAGDE